MGEDFAEKANRAKPKYPRLDDMKAEVEDKESDYRTHTVHSGLLSPKASALVAHREANPSKPDSSSKNNFKINKRPQSATIKPKKELGLSNPDINIIEEAKEQKRSKRAGADADDNLLLKTKIMLAGDSLRVAVMHDADNDGLVFYVYSRKSQFAQKVFVEMDVFKAIQSEGLGVESTLERMVARLKGNTESGIVYC